ncbi:MAG: hypothetical protein U0791_12815 [Gemmataceae bacterium]
MFRVFACVLPLILIGCGGDEKQLPTDVVAPGKSDEPEAVVPKESEPEAKKFVEKCIAAATANHPERLEKLKVNRLSESGRQLQGTSFVPTTRKIAATWPDRFLFTDESTVNGPVKLSIGLKQLVLSFRRNDEPFDPGMPKGYEQVLFVDSVGLHWMLTLVPLADSKTVVFNAKKQSAGNQMADTVQAAVPGCPPFTLWFDEKTSLLGLVTYQHLEGGVSKLYKRQASAEHKDFGGVLLPTKLEFERSGVTVENWTISKWEFPDKIEDAVFDQKK